MVHTDGAAVGARVTVARALGKLGVCPRRIWIHARAHTGSVSASGRPARASAAATASSWVAAPPSEASGRWKGTRLGGADHHAAQKKRRRLVTVIEQTGAKMSATRF